MQQVTCLYRGGIVAKTHNYIIDIMCMIIWENIEKHKISGILYGTYIACIWAIEVSKAQICVWKYTHRHWPTYPEREIKYTQALPRIYNASNEWII
jgi:hypothetical protein